LDQLQFNEDVKVCSLGQLRANCGRRAGIPEAQVIRHQVPHNGNCFFESVARLLHIEGINGMYLRALMAAELESQLPAYRAFFAIIDNINNNISAYIRRISQASAWVDGLAMSALRNGLVRSGVLPLQQMPSFVVFHAVNNWMFTLGNNNNNNNDNAALTLNFFYDDTHYEGFEFK
jgi:hypothetical protein